MKSSYQKPSCIAIHKPPAQPRTAKAPLKASRTEERFGSHSSSACLWFEREDSLFKAGTCSGRAGLCASLTHCTLTNSFCREAPAGASPSPTTSWCFPNSEQILRGKSPVISPKCSHQCDRAPACTHPMQLVVPSAPCGLNSSDPPFPPRNLVQSQKSNNQ